MALQNIYACILEPSKCCRTQRFVYVGQNLAKSCADLYYENTEDIIINSLYAWSNEHKNGPQPRSKITHFTQMVRDKAFAVGCAIIKSSLITTKNATHWYCHYLACNYATGNAYDLTIYEVGPMGEKCKSGKNPNYLGLCSEHENY